MQWKEDRAIPRQEFLKLAKGADGILCLLTDKIDAELLDAAGIAPHISKARTSLTGFTLKLCPCANWFLTKKNTRYHCNRPAIEGGVDNVGGLRSRHGVRP